MEFRQLNRLFSSLFNSLVTWYTVLIMLGELFPSSPPISWRAAVPVLTPIQRMASSPRNFGHPVLVELMRKLVFGYRSGFVGDQIMAVFYFKSARQKPQIFLGTLHDRHTHATTKVLHVHVCHLAALVGHVSYLFDGAHLFPESCDPSE
jgi:hypothetical protein